MRVTMKCYQKNNRREKRVEVRAAKLKSPKLCKSNSEQKRYNH